MGKVSQFNCGSGQGLYGAKLGGLHQETNTHHMSPTAQHHACYSHNGLLLPSNLHCFSTGVDIGARYVQEMSEGNHCCISRLELASEDSFES